jgi:hypothetical protein
MKRVMRRCPCSHGDSDTSRNPASVDKIASWWSNTRRASWDGRMYAQRLFDACVEIWKFYNRIEGDSFFVCKGRADFVGELCVALRVPDQASDEARQGGGCGFAASDTASHQRLCRSRTDIRYMNNPEFAMISSCFRSNFSACLRMYQIKSRCSTFVAWSRLQSVNKSTLIGLLIGRLPFYLLSCMD